MVENKPNGVEPLPQGETLRTVFQRRLTEAIRRRDAAYVLSGGNSPEEDAALTIARGEIGALGMVLRRLRESHGIDDITLTGQVIVFESKGETASSEQVAALKAQLATERRKLTRQRSASAAKIAVLSARADISPEEVTVLRREITALRARQDITFEEVAGLRNEITVLSGRAEISPDELTRLLGELHQTKKQLRERPSLVERDALEKKLAKALIDLTTSEGQLKQALRERSEMRMQLQRAEATRRSVQRRADTATIRRREDVKEVQDALRAKEMQLQQEIEANETLRRENIALEAEVTRLREELSRHED